MATGTKTPGGFWRCPKCSTPNLKAAYISACMGCGSPRPPDGFEAPEPPEVESVQDRDGKRQPRFAAPRLALATAGYGGFLLLVWVLLRVIGDRWWPGALLAMSPRWVLLFPLVVLAVWCLRKRRGWIGGAVAVETLVVLGPIMGFNIPWTLAGAAPDGPRIRIMTFNRGSSSIDAAGLVRYLERQAVQVVCFQEGRADPRVEAMLIGKGWSFNANKSIGSLLPIVREFPALPQRNANPHFYTAMMDRSRLKGPEGREFTVASVHMPTPRWGYYRLMQGDLAGFVAKLEWWNGEFDRLIQHESETDRGPVLIAGDFNNAPEASILVDLRNRDAYRSAFEDAGIGWGYTRPSAFSWVRIDQILGSPEFTFTACWPGPSFGSDHKSLVAEAALSR